MNNLLIILIPLLPLLAVIANALFGRTLGPATSKLACGAMIGTAVCSVLLWAQLAFSDVAYFHVVLFNWIVVGDFAVQWAFLVDPLSSIMLLVVSIVGSLVFVYAQGYMKGDDGYARFFTYLPLFAFSMYILVLGDSFLTLFVGWEGVGLCSYLLIGFWYKKMFSDTMSNADAGRKAFVVNRIGDFGFLLGMFLIYWNFGSLNFLELFHAENGILTAVLHDGRWLDSGLMIAIALLLFVGAAGKSAQIPLFVWLPDAMAGPTPVSALIHAATMVTAGVYMMARCSAIYVSAPTALLIVAIIGTATAFVAATIAITQRDIKKVLAYSTVSQLGYMFLACGAGAFHAGIFHVFTHAFFKACLFLCAGSVIYALHHEQDMFKMGGLRKKMPWTAFTYLVSCLAIAGIVPFAGFFSKDAILEYAFERWYLYGDGWYLFLWVVALATAFMTAFYMFRSYFITFEGESRVDPHHRDHVHESPPVMVLPLKILAAGAVLAGLVGIPFWPHLNYFKKFLSPVIAHAPYEDHAYMPGGVIALLTLVSLGLAIGGIVLAKMLYSGDWEPASQRRARQLAPLYSFSYHKWWIDEFYRATVVRLTLALSRWCLGVDGAVVDGAVNGSGGASRAAGLALRIFHNGRVQGYAIIMLAAAVIITVLMVVSQLQEGL